MERFKNGDRVVVTFEEEDAGLFGMKGTVHRTLTRDRSAWVRMDDPLPDGLARFPADDERARDIILWPDECSPLDEG